MDVSSEMIHGLLPVFLVSVLHTPAIYVGLIEGISESTALIGRTVSGVLSDWLGKRKILALAGYTLATLTKPLFALASSVDVVFAARFLDRLGKGIRGAPRDALIADATPLHLRGAAYGLRQSLDNVGAFLGPALAIVLMIVYAGDFRRVFWVAVIPGVISVTILTFAVREPAGLSGNIARQPTEYREILNLGRSYWLVVAFGSAFNLARFSEAFLLLRAENIGLAIHMVPAILIIMSVVYAVSAYPAGHLSDRMGRTGFIVAGLCVLIVSHLVLAAAETSVHVGIGAGLWGLHMGLTQGLLAAMVSDTADEKRRGTAFGLFSMISGLAMLMASLFAGMLWDYFGPPAPFWAGSIFAAGSLVGFVVFRGHLTNG
ncbi:MAG: MFS transporter [Desulfobacterales bacterium]